MSGLDAEIKKYSISCFDGLTMHKSSTAGCNNRTIGMRESIALFVESCFVFAIQWHWRRMDDQGWRGKWEEYKGNQEVELAG